MVIRLDKKTVETEIHNTESLRRDEKKKAKQGEKYLPILSYVMIHSMDSPRGRAKTIDTYHSFPPEKKIALYHGTKGDYTWAQKIIRSESHGVIQNTPTLAIVPVGVFWERGSGLMYHVPRGEIAFPGEDMTGKKFILDERGIVTKVSKSELTPVSMFEYEGRIALHERADLPPEARKQIIQENQWLESAYQRLRPLRNDVKEALSKLQSVVSSFDIHDEWSPERHLRRAMRDSASFEYIDFSEIADMPKRILAIEEWNGEIAEKSLQLKAEYQGVIQQREVDISQLSALLTFFKKSQSSLTDAEDMTRSFFKQKERGGAMHALRSFFGIEKRRMEVIGQRIDQVVESFTSDDFKGLVEKISTSSTFLIHDFLTKITQLRNLSGNDKLIDFLSATYTYQFIISDLESSIEKLRVENMNTAADIQRIDHIQEMIQQKIDEICGRLEMYHKTIKDLEKNFPKPEREVDMKTA